MSEQPNLEQLKSVITDIDGISQYGLSEIFTLANVALKLMETKDAYTHPETIAQLLSSIRVTAEETENLINCVAGDVGCDYTNQAAERRHAARRAAKGM